MALEHLEGDVYHTGLVVGEHNGLHVIQCAECGYIHQWPLPAETALDNYYGEADAFYATHAPPDWFAHEESQGEYWAEVYADWLDLLAAQVGRRQPGRLLDEPLRLLDIGCGSGGLLQKARQKGWDVLGVEPSAQARQRCEQKGIPVVPSLGSVAGPFDAITLVLVLEHLLNPLAMLRTAWGLLTNGGAILVETPNDFNAWQNVARTVHNLPMWFVAKPHINYFHFSSLRRLLWRAGFLVVNEWATFPIEYYLLARDTPYVGNEPLGRAVYREKMAFEMNLYRHEKTALHALQAAWARLGIGREIVQIGVKRSDDV